MAKWGQEEGLPKMLVLPLYAGLPANQQLRIFQPAKEVSHIAYPLHKGQSAKLRTPGKLSSPPTSQVPS